MAWADEINKYLDTISPYVPHMPLTGLVLGPTNGGKTTLLMNLIKLYANPKGFKNVVILSPTAECDPSWFDVSYLRHPDVNLRIISDVNDCRQVIKDAFARVKRIYSSAKKFSEVPKAQRNQRLSMLEHLNGMKQDSILHPYLGEDGKPHGHKPNLPTAWSKPLDPLTRRICFTSERWLKQYSQKDRAGAMLNEKVPIGTQPHQTFSIAEPGLSIAGITPMPINLPDSTKQMDMPINLVLWSPDAILQYVNTNHFVRDRTEKEVRYDRARVFSEVNDDEPTLIVIDDCIDLCGKE